MNRAILGYAFAAITVCSAGCVIEPPTPEPNSFKDTMSVRYSACSALVSEEKWRDELIKLVNAERAAVGLNALVQNETLTAQATQYACEMIQYDFFGHVNPVTGSRLRDRSVEFDYCFQKIGENLAAVPPRDCNPRDVMDYWMSSPGHRANILEPDFTEIGIGIRTGGAYGTYWVQEFGRPAE